MEAIPNPPNSEIYPPHTSDQSPGSGAVTDEARTSVRELLPTEIDPEELLGLLEEGGDRVPPDVVGSVQQVGKLYGRYGVLVRGPLLLLGS